MRRRNLLQAAAALAAATRPLGTWAQYRADDAPVLPAAPAADPAPAGLPVADPTPRFAQAYARAGRPRILLMWNRELDDATQERSVDRLVIRDSVQGAAGRTDSFQRETVVTAGRQVLKNAPRRTTLTEAQATMVQRAFSDAMGRGGVQFVDRTLALRTTAATRHRSGGDTQLIETDALLAQSDLLMEVLLVADDQAPLGYAFDVRVKQVRSGAEGLSLYVRAAVPPPPAAPGRWVAGRDGYEFQLPPPAPPPTPQEAGVALAREVMAAWQERLTGAPAGNRTGR
jgi:hypothetical protein